LPVIPVPESLGYSDIPHPQTRTVDKGKLPEGAIGHWAARFYSWMASI
jgi:hypothetical protein